LVGLVFWFHVILSEDTAKRTVSQTFAASISMQSDDASQVFRKFDSDLKYEWKTDKLQLEMADEFGISLYHGGVAYRHRDRFVFRFAAQTSRKKITSSTSLAMEGPLFPKRELLIDQNRGNYLSASKGGFLNPSQLSLNSGIRFIVFKGASLDVSIPSLMLNRLYDMGSKPLLFLNGYRFKYQQWNQELRIAWMMRKNMEWVLQARFSEDRTVAPKVLKWYSLRLGYRLGRVK